MAGGLTFGVLYLNLRVAQRGLVPNPVVLQLGPEAQRVDVSAALRRLSLPLSLGFGLLRASPDTTIRALVAEAWRRYQWALEANREADWARYGEEFRRPGEALERLRAPEEGQ